MLLRLVVTVVLLGAVLAACRLPDNALDGPIAVPLRVVADARSMDVDAPTWFAPETAIYLCTAVPDTLPEPGPARVGWQPGAACREVGRQRSAQGLRVVLDLAALPDDLRGDLGSADTWYVLLVKLDGERASAAIHTAVRRPEGFD